MTHKVSILGGEAPEPDAEPITYTFDTSAELISFMKGIREAEGWFGWTVVEKEETTPKALPEYRCFRCDSVLTQDPNEVSNGYFAACLHCAEDMYYHECIPLIKETTP